MDTYTHIMPATGYHYSAKIISRKSGQSAVAAVAYRTGNKLHEHRTGELKDYHRKPGVEFVFHAAPENAPAWASNLEEAWNRKEQAEDKSTCPATAQLARDYTVTFPHQLNAQQREWMLKDFQREEFARKHLLSTGAIHAPDKHGDQRNYHAHILVSDRTLNADGYSKTKVRSWKSRHEQAAHEAQALLHLKQRWAELGARQLERAGFPQEAERWRHGYKTLEDQRQMALARNDLDFARECEREAGIKLGKSACQMERQGIATDRGDRQRAIEARNAERGRLQKELETVTHDLDQETARVRLEQEQARIRAAQAQERERVRAEQEREQARLKAERERAQPVANDNARRSASTTATLERAVHATERAASGGLRVASGLAGRVSNKLTDVVDGLLDVFVAPPPRKNTVAEFLNNREARREQYQQISQARQREEAIDRMAEDIRSGRLLSPADVRNLNHHDLISIKQFGDDYMRQLIEERERERRRELGGRERERER